MRLGIMGGTFDPIHFGHLACAESVLSALDLDKIIFIPTGNPSFKQERDLADAEDRLKMCELACNPNEGFEVSRMEIDRSGITYTSDTIRELKELFPESQIYFIMGSDSLLTLHEWHESDMLIGNVSFAVVMRPGDDRPEVERYISEHGIDAKLVDCPLLDISSSTIRQMASDGKSFRYLTPDDVCDYIIEHRLYDV